MLVASMAVPASGYVPFVDQAGKPFSWDVPAQPGGQIVWQADPAAPPILREAMLYATQHWSEATNGKLNFVESAAPFTDDGTFFGVTLNWDSSGTRLIDPGFLAYATFSVSASTGRIATSRIVVNAHDYSWHRGEPYGQTYGAGSTRVADLDGVLLHELGHGIGLDHSDKNPAAMVGSSSASNYPTMNSIVFAGIESLHMDDVAGVQALYGVGDAVVNGYDAGTTPLTIVFERAKRKKAVTYNFRIENGGDASTIWDFGDDEQAVGTDVQHRYRWRGQFTVTALCNGKVATVKVQGLKGKVRLVDLLRGAK